MNQEEDDIFELILKSALKEVADQEIKNLPKEIELIPKVYLSENFECNMKKVIRERKKIMWKNRRITFLKRFVVFAIFLSGVILIRILL